MYYAASYHEDGRTVLAYTTRAERDARVAADADVIALRNSEVTIVCKRCTSLHTADVSCDCFDNGCQ